MHSFHLQISQGEIFVAEIKVWDGQKSLGEVVAQLLERLTWRDAFGVAIIFSKNAAFSGVAAAIEAAMPTLPGLQPVQPYVSSDEQIRYSDDAPGGGKRAGRET